MPHFVPSSSHPVGTRHKVAMSQLRSLQWCWRPAGKGQQAKAYQRHRDEVSLTSKDFQEPGEGSPRLALSQKAQAGMPTRTEDQDSFLQGSVAEWVQRDSQMGDSVSPQCSIFPESSQSHLPVYPSRFTGGELFYNTKGFTDLWMCLR